MDACVRFHSNEASMLLRLGKQRKMHEKFAAGKIFALNRIRTCAGNTQWIARDFCSC